MQPLNSSLYNLSLFLIASTMIFSSATGFADGGAVAKREALRKECPQEAKGDLMAILRQMAPFVKLDDVEMVSAIAANCLPSVSGQGERLVGLTIKFCVKRITEELKLSLASQLPVRQSVEKCTARFEDQKLEPGSREQMLANDAMWLCKLQIYSSFYKKHKALVVNVPGEPKLIAMVEPGVYDETPRFEAKYFYERIQGEERRKCLAFSIDTAGKTNGENFALTFTYDADRYHGTTFFFGPKLELGAKKLDAILYDYANADQYDSQVTHTYERVTQVVDGRNFLADKQYYVYFCYKEEAGKEYPSDLRLLNLSYQFTDQLNHTKYDDQDVVLFLIRNTKEELELNRKLNRGH